MKNILISYLISVVFLIPNLYFNTPVLNIRFESMFDVLTSLFGVALFIQIGIDFIAKTKQSLNKNKENGSVTISFKERKEASVKLNIRIKKYIKSVTGILFVGSVLLSIILPFLTSTHLLYSNKYRNLIGTVEYSNFSEDVSPVDTNNVRIVDEDMAIRLGDKKLGEIPAIGSVAKLGEFNIQNINNNLYWVAPLVHRDFIKWITNIEGTPGYVMVSASNPQDVKLIQEYNGKSINIKYQNNSYFNHDIKRHVYLKGFVNKGLTDFTFEIDDNGKPYWVVTLYTNKIGLSGSDAIGVVTVDASSGEINEYDIEKAPAWIDRVQPQSFIETQINDWGAYVNGFWNAIFSQKGVLQRTEGTSLVYGNDGQSYWYTGITSAGADESTVGFILVNTRTKESKMYKQSGATELAAMSSAQGKVQEKGYVATFPVMYNVMGTPTYAMSMKDKAGLVKMISFVSVKDYSVLGIGETKEEALRNYKEVLKNSGNNIIIEDSVENLEIEGVVTRINNNVQDGKSYYLLKIDSSPNQMFISTSNVSIKLPITQIGDRVKISYENSEEMPLNIVSFENLTLN